MTATSTPPIEVEESGDQIWKAEDQQLAVIVSVKGKSYEVALSQEQKNSILFILPQLFDDHKIKLHKVSIKGLVLVKP